jgi:hypothetical protein
VNDRASPSKRFAPSSWNAGLRLTVEQVARLCGVDSSACKAILEALVDAKFLRADADGAYSGLSDGEPGINLRRTHAATACGR